MWRLQLLLITACFFSQGCASMTTTTLNRHDSDGFSKNSRFPERGIPITLKVPTHLKVWIEEEFYLQAEGEAEADAAPGAEGADTAEGKVKNKLSTVSLGGNRIIKVQSEYDYSEKVFTVDFKRPGAGTIRTDISLDPDSQYFKSIHSKVVDNTIREITSIVDQFSPVLAKSTSAGTDIASKIITDTRVVAYTRLDINAHDFEAQLAGFLDEHINLCHNCTGVSCPKYHAEELPPYSRPITNSRQAAIRPTRVRDIPQKAPPRQSVVRSPAPKRIYEDNLMTISDPGIQD